MSEKKKNLLEKREELIKVVCNETGWDRAKAFGEMKKAKAQGMPYYRYVKNECWKLDSDEIVALNKQIEERLERNKEKKQGYLDDICSKTGWERSAAEKAMEDAKAIGVPYRQYAEKELYTLNEEELKEFANTLEILRKKRSKDKEFYISHVCKKTGWTEKEAAKDMENARAEYGITALKYIQKQFWAQENKERLAKFIENDKKRINANKAKYIADLKEKTGWDRAKIELEVNKAKCICGASYEDFLVFKMYEKSPEEQAQYVTLDMFNKMRIKFNDHFVGAANFDDKAQFNRNFADNIERKWFVNRDISFEEFAEIISDLDKVIIKPLAATQGIGIEVANCNVEGEEVRKLYDYIMGRETCIVEQYIVQHDDVKAFCASSVNTVRVLTLNYNGECKFLYSVFRMGRDGVVDNFHAGGIAATVDVETGKIITNAVDLDGNIYTHSPSTGKEIKGFQLPNWDKVMDLCRAITGKIEGANMVGWDFAITPDGVDLIEGNPGASYVVAQIPLIQENKGLAAEMVYPYL